MVSAEYLKEMMSHIRVGDEMTMLTKGMEDGTGYLVDVKERVKVIGVYPNIFTVRTSVGITRSFTAFDYWAGVQIWD